MANIMLDEDYGYGENYEEEAECPSYQMHDCPDRMMVNDEDLLEGITTPRDNNGRETEE